MLRTYTVVVLHNNSVA